MHVLLVDDEIDFTELMGTLLGFHGFTTTVLNDSTKVLPALAAGTFHVIITDLMMPDLDGFALIRALREDPKYRTAPVIALSAKMLTDSERKFLLQQQVHFVMKPFEPTALVEKIVQLCQL